MTELEAWKALAQWTIAAAGLFQWLAGCGEREQDDANVVESHEWLMDKASDATHVAVVETLTGHNIRDQHSLEEMQALHEGVELARMRGSRN
jgi:hypothetical protein